MTKRLPSEIKAANKIKFGKIRSDRMMGEGNHFYGKHHNQNAVEKNRQAHLGKPGPNLGKKLSEDTKDKIRKARIGNFCKLRIPTTIAPPSKSKTILLSSGKVAIVDFDDYERLNIFLWCVSKRGNIFYIHRALGNGKYETMHHAIMGLPKKGLMIDHINGDGLDNRKCNLRVVTNRENCLNKHWSKGNEIHKTK
ncbi:MAG: HNH endonuclease [Thermoplasmata archaeon]|nr:HNH endonuclease [Thermoplasmata archaeon]